MITSTHNSPTLPGLDAGTTTPSIPAVVGGALIDFSTIGDGKLKNEVNGHIAKADKAIADNGGNGTAIITLKLKMVGAGIYRSIEMEADTKLKDIRKATLVASAVHVDGELREDVTPPKPKAEKPKRTRKKKDEPAPDDQGEPETPAAEEAEDLPSPDGDDMPGDEGGTIVPFEDGFEPAEPVDLQTA